MLRANDVRPNEPTRYGCYVCLRVPLDVRPAAAACDIRSVAERLGFVNEFVTDTGHPPAAIAFLRRVDASPGAIEHQGLLLADAVVHVASSAEGSVKTCCSEIAGLLPPGIGMSLLGGVARPASYTGNAMHNFAYAHQVVQQPGPVMPHAFVLPTKKTDAWWVKDWMERHTYFLPRYDADGRMVCEGHALAAERGIPCILRRTYRSPTEPAPSGSFDFVNYFECADTDVPTFYAVCTALRDVKRNPEWKFVREGPTWRGIRVAAWSELFE